MKIALKQLLDDSVILTNKFNGTIVTLNQDDIGMSITLESDDYIVEKLPENTMVDYLGEHIVVIEDNKYYMDIKTPYTP